MEHSPTSPPMTPGDALAVLTVPPENGGRCPVCAIPVGWLGTDARADHERYHRAQAILAAAVLGVRS